MAQNCDADLRKLFEKVYEIAEECSDGWKDLEDGIGEIMRLLEEHSDLLV